jgi:glycosyltransferase involved in cell wall biosynthesis
MHLGKAQVVTDSVGLHDYLKDGENVRVVAPNDPAAFSEAITELLDDSALREKLGTSARTFAAERCSEKVTVEAFRRLVKDLAS